MLSILKAIFNIKEKENSITDHIEIKEMPAKSWWS